jgi:hypothetical protein
MTQLVQLVHDETRGGEGGGALIAGMLLYLLLVLSQPPPGIDSYLRPSSLLLLLLLLQILLLLLLYLLGLLKPDFCNFICCFPVYRLILVDDYTSNLYGACIMSTLCQLNLVVYMCVMYVHI